MSTVNLLFEIPPECENYLESSARMRGISRTQLVRRVVEFVLRDQLVLSVLDDEDRPSAKTAARRQHATKRHLTPRVLPAHSVAETSSSVPQRPNRETFSFRRKTCAMTKAEMQEDLRRAVMNTGGSES